MTDAVSRRQLSAVAAAYSLATTPFNIAPLLVGGLITVMGASEQQSGQLMTLELLSMSVVAMVATPLGDRARRPLILALATLVLVVVHILSAMVQVYALLLALRVVAGVGAGILLLAVNTTIAASGDPVRLYGAGAVAGTSLGVALLFLMPPLIADHGLAGAYGPLAIVALVVLGFVRWMASTTGAASPEQVPQEKAEMGVSPLRVALMLFALFVIQMTQAALYAFSERMGVEAVGLSTADMGLLLAVGYLSAVPASVLASWLSYRLGRYLPLILGFVAYGMATLTMAVTASVQLFVVSFVLFNFSYFFVLPYQLGIPADLDHSGKLSGVGVGTIFIGLSCGAFLGGVLVSQFGFTSLGIVAAATACAGVCLLLYVIGGAGHPAAGAPGAGRPAA